MERNRPPLATGAVCVALALAACARQPAEARVKPAATPAATAATDPAAPTVVAFLDGAPITMREVDLRAANHLASIRQQEYDARRDAIEEMVAEKLMEREAAWRRVTVGELLKAEVDAKADPVSPQDVARLYEQNKARFAGRSREQALADIESAMKKRNLDARRFAFQEELRKRASVKITLEAPRQDLAVPPGAPVLGPKTARVTILEFADYQCPYCQRAEESVVQLLKEYEGKVRFVHRDFPLPNHDRAFAAARASRCAGEQGRFWDFRKSLLASPGDFSDDDFRKRAATLGLEGTAFASCIQSDRLDAAIKESQDDGVKAGVNATPTFFFNGRMQTGAASIEELRRIIGEELERAGS
jgi:protein-disulfide isomerase